MATGISAPPIEMVSNTPSSKPIAIMATYEVVVLGSITIQTPHPSATNPRSTLSGCCPGNVTGASGRSKPRNLSNATRLPVKVTEPIMPEAAVAMSDWVVGVVPTSTAPATRAEAPPPKAFKRATISGMAVIWILRANVAPMAAPRTMPASITPSPNVPLPKT